jgi:hypothetical protein
VSARAALWNFFQTLIVYATCWHKDEKQAMTTWSNESVETNRRPALPLNAGWQFDGASCTPLFLSAAVAHLSLAVILHRT